MLRPAVDIIVPIYNVSKYLNKCIDSLIVQTYKDITIILVDDGSTDESGIICDKYAKNDERIKVIHKKNGGLVSAWKTGLMSANSEWVVFVDGDDWIEHQHIELLITEQIRTSADIVVTRMKQIDNEKEEYIEFCIPSGKYNGERLKNELYPLMINAGGFEKRGVPFSRCSKLIRKSIIFQNLQYLYDNATYEEDFNIIAPCLMDAVTISLIQVENAAYCYRRVESSMLHGYDKNMKNSINNIYPRLIKACESKSKENFINQIEFEYISAVVRLFLNETKNPNGYKAMYTNIQEMVTSPMFINSIKKINMNEYALKYRIILKIVSHYNNILCQMTSKMIYMLRKFGISHD